jgi:MtN3 and saliva related transmembrane protein
LSSIEIVGLVAGGVTTFSYLPQVIRVYRLKSAYEISLTFTLFFTLGLGGWLTYGILLGQLPLVLWNAFSLALALAMLYAKLKYGHRQKTPSR